MKWRDLPAGPELDALVAEQVLGWTRVCIRNVGLWGCRPEHTYELHGDLAPVPDYSTKMAAAWLVVAAMVAKGHSVDIDNRRQHRKRSMPWTVAFAWPDMHHQADPREAAKTAPLAICRAALRALEGSVDRYAECDQCDGFRRLPRRAAGQGDLW